MAMDVPITSGKQQMRQRVHYGINNRPFDRGVVDLVDPSELPLNAVQRALNLIQIENGYYTKRPGTSYYGTASDYEIDGGTVHYHTSGAPHLLRMCNGTLQVSTNDGTTWSNCTGASFTAGVKTTFFQGGTATPITWVINGTNNIAKYNGTTTLTTYTSVSSPTGVTFSGTGLGTGSYKHYYAVVAVNDVGFTAVSSECNTTTAQYTRSEFTASIYATVSWSAATGASRYDVYYGDTSGQLHYIDSTTGLSYKDIGTADINYLITPPADNTTTGPKFQDAEIIDNRIWGCKDSSNPHRVYWAGSGTYAGYFSPYYGGGWIDLDPGTSSKVMKVTHYRDGKGTSYATVFTSDPDGNGAIWQISLATKISSTDISYVEPSAYKLVGSRGADATGSVVHVLNDIMFMNRNGMFSLRSKPQMLNLLSTDEMTANIRNFMNRITETALDKIVAIHHNSKVFVSVPIDDSSYNNRTMVFDTERNNWNPEAFSIGFERMFHYTDTTGVRHLLAWLPDGKQFVEISDNYSSDLGAVISTELTTGLIQVTPDRFSFFKANDMEVEISDATGTIQVELSGYDRHKGYKTLAIMVIQSITSVSGGWSSFCFSSKQWGSITTASPVVSEPSTKRYIKVNKTINNFIFSVRTSTMDGNYTGPRVLQVYGKLKRSKKPVAWRATKI